MSSHNTSRRGSRNNSVDVIQNNAAMVAGSYDGLKTVQIIEKIYAAAESL